MNDCPVPTTQSAGELVRLSELELDFFFPTEDAVRGLVAFAAKLAEYERRNLNHAVSSFRLRFTRMEWRDPRTSEQHSGNAFRALVELRLKTVEELAN